MRWLDWRLALGTLLFAGACGGNPEPPVSPQARASYEALPDTLVCVVDRTTDRGLRTMDGKKTPEGRVILLTWEGVRPLDELHPVSLIAGYGGEEPWLTSRGGITIQNRRYNPSGGPRRVPAESLQMRGDYQGIPLFADPRDGNPPAAVYVPLRPGCIFQPYVRS